MLKNYTNHWGVLNDFFVTGDTAILTRQLMFFLLEKIQEFFFHNSENCIEGLKNIIQLYFTG